MTMLSFRVDDRDAADVQRWAESLGVDRSELLREALRRHLDLLASEGDADRWEAAPMDEGERALAEVADWGPAIKAADVKGEWLFVPSDGVRGSGKRVDKCFPVIHEWGGNVTFHVLDETITEDVFLNHLKQAGAFIGIGRFRPRNNGFYGRFAVQSVTWQ